MGFRVYAKAGTMRVNPFRDGDTDTAQVTLERVIYPRAFLSRLRTYPKAEFVSAECFIRKRDNRLALVPLRLKDLVAFHFPAGTIGVNVRFKVHDSFGDSLLSIVAKRAKLNRLKQKLSVLRYQLETGRLKFCFGTKRLLKQDYKKFTERRDSQMTFVGAKNEASCNQVLQLTYSRRSNQFLIRLRKDFGGYKSAKGEDRYAYGKVYFNHHKAQIVSILRSKASPLSYRIAKKNGRYYLYCIFEFQADSNDFVTRSDYGTIGLDFNKGFVTLSETNQYGHLVQTQFLPYRFKSGNKTKSDLQEVTNHAVRLALRKGKDVCIENLDFRAKKAKTEAKQGKKYNAMLHSLAYREFSEVLESVAYRNRVGLNKVHPAWTSWLAERLYCKPMKLNIHTGASYVIARRGQGHKDAVKSM